MKSTRIIKLSIVESPKNRSDMLRRFLSLVGHWYQRYKTKYAKHEYKWYPRHLTIPVFDPTAKRQVLRNGMVERGIVSALLWNPSELILKFKGKIAPNVPCIMQYHHNKIQISMDVLRIWLQSFLRNLIIWYFDYNVISDVGANRLYLTMSLSSVMELSCLLRQASSLRRTSTT